MKTLENTLNDDQFEHTTLKLNNSKRATRTGFKIVEDLATTAHKAEKAVIQLDLIGYADRDKWIMED